MRGPDARNPKKALAEASALLGLSCHSPGKRAPGWVTSRGAEASPSPSEVALIR